MSATTSTEVKSYLANARAYIKAAHSADDSRERARCAQEAMLAAGNALQNSKPGSYANRAAEKLADDAQTMMGR